MSLPPDLAALQRRIHSLSSSRRRSEFLLDLTAINVRSQLDSQRATDLARLIQQVERAEAISGRRMTR